MNPDGLKGSIISGLKYATARTVDDSDPGFSYSTESDWTTFRHPECFGGSCTLSPPNLNVSANFVLPVIKERQQRVSISWYASTPPYNQVYSSRVIFRVINGGTILSTKEGNIRMQPNDFTDLGVSWLDLGTFIFS